MQTDQYQRVLAIAALTALVGLAFAPEPTQLALAWERSTIFGGQFWRLWTAHWVHFSMAHALVNIAVFVAACTVAAATLGARFIGWAIFIVSPVISIGLLITSPTLVEYRGLSGLATAMTVAALYGLAYAHRSLRWVIAVLAITLLLKLVAEANGLTFSSHIHSLPEGASVEWRAHLIGALSAIIYALSRSLRIMIRPAHANLP